MGWNWINHYSRKKTPQTFTTGCTLLKTVRRNKRLFLATQQFGKRNVRSEAIFFVCGKNVICRCTVENFGDEGAGGGWGGGCCCCWELDFSCMYMSAFCGQCVDQNRKYINIQQKKKTKKRKCRVTKTKTKNRLINFLNCGWNKNQTRKGYVSYAQFIEKCVLFSPLPISDQLKAGKKKKRIMEFEQRRKYSEQEYHTPGYYDQTHISTLKPTLNCTPSHLVLFLSAFSSVEWL